MFLKIDVYRSVFVTRINSFNLQFSLCFDKKLSLVYFLYIYKYFNTFSYRIYIIYFINALIFYIMVLDFIY